MKKIFLPVSICLMLAACSTPHEERLEIYSNAVEEFYETKELPLVIKNLLKTEMSATRVYASLPELEKREFVALLESDEAVKAAAMRDSLLRLTENAYLAHVLHFVEKRTVLYGEAASCYKNVESLEELHAIEELVAHYSAVAYVDGERACDPPADVREMYKASQKSATRAYADAEHRLADK